jgi:DNA-binding HxlR family transcriptional regulator
VDADPYAAGCRSRQVIDRIGDRWTVLLLGALSDGPRRFTELARRVDGISQKMLTQTLRALERDGIVEREVIPTVPVTVRYTLTPLGHSLADVVSVIREWAYAKMDAIEAARAEYEPRTGSPPTPTAVPAG